ncbi:MAG TPA: hypothetical protein VE776_10655 [Actinomycetota bacterium]|nr:hypothetical protein [Actinomycetota bacterium]
MAGRLAGRRRRWWLVGLALLAVVAVMGASGSWVVWRHFHEGQRMRIPGAGATFDGLLPFVDGDILMADG